MNSAAVNFATLTRELIDQGKSIRFRAEGFSMYPVICDQDIVTMSPVQGEDLCVGDIVIYSQDSKPRIHRIVRKEKSFVTIRGDTNTGIVETIAYEDIWGRLSLVERDGKHYHHGYSKRRFKDILLSRAHIFKRKYHSSLAVQLRFMQRSGLYKKIAKMIQRSPVTYVWNKDKESQVCLSATSRGKIAARLYLSPPEEDEDRYSGWWIHGMWVCWRLRRLNIATTMLFMAEQYAKEKGAERLGLLVFKDNVAAMKLYTKLGFSRIIILSMEEELKQEAAKNPGKRRRVMLDKVILDVGDGAGRSGILKRELSPEIRSTVIKAAKNALLAERAKELLSACNCENIAVILLKGIYLSEHIYKHQALRPMSDIDILIKRNDLVRMDAVLNSLGYQAPLCFDDFLDNRSHLSINTLMYTVKESGQPLIHVHWHLVNSTWPITDIVRSFDMERIWHDKMEVEIQGEKAYSLAPEHLIAYLAYHCFNHFFKKDVLIADIIKVIDFYSDEIKWDFFIRQVNLFKITDIVCFVFDVMWRDRDFQVEALKRYEFYKKNLKNNLLFGFFKKSKSKTFFCFCIYLLRQNGFINKFSFIKNILFPNPLIIAHSKGSRLSEVGYRDYLKRLFPGLFA
jgi:GNAT superfamily N-acetyltransferase